ncbi:DUF2516 family protein [Streptomonospora sp. S1-112]|uniref:DUF2516 family protein n=1 Tax=Streptomonospora mangrovi TaxID=2883123 RepID=A0A9X3SHA2_9ACTN|nr:DUF2516 family protein [Streptomonospora mangrovi]MDA0565034.1 DUF2516 family protein [Streptomonospora mangrovi]
MLGTLSLVWWLIYVAIFVTSLFALVDAARTPSQAFPAMDKQTKKMWLILLGVSTFVSFSAVFTSVRFFVFIALIVALIYLLDVRPAVRGIGRKDGPYGPW